MSKKRGQRLEPARVLYTVDNITTGEDWAGIETVGSNPAAPINHLAVPMRQADDVVALINDAHQQLAAMLDAYLADDPAWKASTTRVAHTADRLRRAAGRPPLPEGETRAEKVTRHLQTHGLEATMRDFDLSAETVLRYQRRASRLRGQ